MKINEAVEVWKTGAPVVVVQVLGGTMRTGQGKRGPWFACDLDCYGARGISKVTLFLDSPPSNGVPYKPGRYLAHVTGWEETNHIPSIRASKLDPLAD